MIRRFNSPVRAGLRAGILPVLAAFLFACTNHEISRHEPVRKKQTQNPASPLNYLVYFPPGYKAPANESESWPVIFVLHGIAEIGTNLRKLSMFGPANQIEQGADFPFVVISPQIANVSWNVERAITFIEYCLDRYRVDRSRVYLTGTSLGGRAVWAIAAARPDLFAAIAPLAGWGKPQEALATAAIPAWLFHGRLDLIIPMSSSEEMYDAHRAAGGDTDLTIFPDLGHTIWDRVYGDIDLYDWFLEHSLVSNP